MLPKTLLYVTESAFWPPFQGDSARNWSIIRLLRSIGWQVHVVHRHDPMQTSDYEGMRQRCESLAVYFSTGKELESATGVDPDAWCPQGLKRMVGARVREVAASTMLVQFPMFSACLGAAPKQTRRVLDADNWFVGRRELYESFGLHYDWFSTTREHLKRAAARADVVMAIQQTEAELYRDLLGAESEVHYVPHCVQGEWNPDKFLSKSILFVGNSNAENISGLRSFLRSTWPSVLEEHPNVELRVAGRVSHHFSSQPQVSLLGEVDDLRGLYAESAFGLNLSAAGTGMKVKSLEALANGCCLVTTPAGVQGHLATNTHVIAGSWAEFARRLNALLSEPSKAAEIGRSAYVHTQNHYNPSAVLRSLLGAISI